MDFTNSQVDINSYVARYMDEMGCSFEQACNDLEIDQSQVFTEQRRERFY